MNARVAVVDYGTGNLLSVERAFRFCGADVTLADRAKAILAADRLVLPGVGAFADAMAGLRSHGLVEPVTRFAETGRPFLGVCVGMQMMFDASEEFGEHDGLGFVPGRVTRIPAVDIEGRPQKVPHIGWNGLVAPVPGAWADGILARVTENAAVYFVHSYNGTPANPAHRLADCLYGGRRITAAIRRDNLFGCQFHPEKSGPVGLQIIESFLGL